MTMTNIEELIASSLNEPIDQLQARFQEKGYLYLRQALPKDQCAGLMKAFLQRLHPHVVFDEKQQQPVLEGEPFFETDPVFDEVYPAIQRLPAFHNFFHGESVQSIMKVVVGDPVFVYPMKMARISTPRKIGYETPPHQDAHSHQSGETMAGIWIPLHDVTETMGRLMVLPGSHKKGVRPVYEAKGVGGIQCEIYADETIWHVSDVSQGDVIIFHACCVHKAEPNTSKDKVRLSIDTRFCDYGAKVYTSNLAPHHGWRIANLTWESIYQQWGDEPNQYYWRDYPYFHGPSEESWRALAAAVEKEPAS